MKTLKTYTISLIILFLVFIRVNESIGQTKVTRYTPLGSPVTAYNNIPGMPSGDKEDWSDHISINYPNAMELNPPSATTSYNCHAYAWHVFEGGDRVWIGYYQGQQDHEDIYWEDGSYIRLNSESGADKISYYEDNHSAIQTSTQGTYISKWGQGPLMQHARDYGPSSYLMNYRKYYDEPAISGDKVLCYPSTKTYSVQDFHNVTYSWSTSPNLQINGSSTGRSVSVSPTSSANGSGYVKVTIDIQDYNETRLINKNVWLGPPLQPTIIPLTYIYGGGEATFRAYLEESEASIYNWSVMGGSIIRGQGTEHLEVMVYPVTHLDLHVSAGNACGTGPLAFKSFDVSNGGGPASVDDFSVHPNPADHKFTVSLEGAKQTRNTEAFEYLLYNARHQMVRRIKTTDVSVEINAADLESGIYFLNIVAGDKILKRKIEIRH
jgi:hypothetical protein